MVSLPCGEEGVDMSLCVGFAVVAGIGVRHGVFLEVGKKLCGGAFWGCAIGRVFETGVIRVGYGGVQPFRNFVSRWLCRHGFERGFFLLRELAGVVDSVDDWSFSYPLSLYASERLVASYSIVATTTRYATVEVHRACTDQPGMPKMLSGWVTWCRYAFLR